MAGFVFELEAVLDQRLMVEQQKRLVVAALERERLSIEGVIRGCQRAITRERDDLRARLRTAQRDGRGETLRSDLGAAAAGGDGLDMRSVRLQAAASLQFVAKAQRAVLQLAGVCKRLDAARLELLGAATRRKAVELLRERRREEWRTEQARREDAALDELNVMRASRSGDAA